MREYEVTIVHLKKICISFSKLTFASQTEYFHCQYEALLYSVPESFETEIIARFSPIIQLQHAVLHEYNRNYMCGTLLAESTPSGLVFTNGFILLAEWMHHQPGLPYPVPSARRDLRAWASPRRCPQMCQRWFDFCVESQAISSALLLIWKGSI